MALDTSLAAHPLADLMPTMSDAEFTELRDDIAEQGLRQPIVLFDGQILDGRHRYRACEEAGVEPAFTTYTGGHPVAEVISLNLKRRHLTPSQRAALVAPLVPELEAEFRKHHPVGRPPKETREKFPEFPSGSRNGRARDIAGELAGVSGRTVKDAHVVYEKAPELHERVLKGEMSVDTAAKEVRRRRQNSGEKPPAKPQKLADDGGPLEGRRLSIARAAKERMAGVIGTCQAWESALNDIPVELAVRVMTTNEIHEWRQQVKAARKALGEFDKRMANGATNA